MSFSSLDMCSLLASRVCHDVISPVGALVNGLELLDDDPDAEMKRFAMDLISSSAKSASTKLKFCRLAFGASGSSGSTLDLGEAEDVCRLYVSDNSKAELDWTGPRSSYPKNRVKLLMNVLLIGLSCVPRGGVVSVRIDDPTDDPSDDSVFSLRCSGELAVIPPVFAEVLDGKLDNVTHDIQPYFTWLLADSEGLTLSATKDGDDVILCAT